MTETIVYYSMLKEVLKRGGYEIGFEAISDNVTKKKAIATYWYYGNEVVCVWHSGGLVSKIKICNTNDTKGTFQTSFKEVTSWLKHELSSPHMQPASILDTFTDVLFADYTSNVDKYEAILSAVKSFTPEFLQLFQQEIDKMTSSETSVVTSVSEGSWYSGPSNELYYVCGLTQAAVLLTEPFDITRSSKILDRRELQNSYNLIDQPTELPVLLHKTLSTMHELCNVDELILVFEALGFSDLTHLKEIGRFPVSPDNSEIVVKHKDFEDTEVIVQAGDFDACITFSINLFVFLNFNKSEMLNSHIPNGKISSVREVICPLQFYDHTRAFLSNIIAKFQPILQNESERELHSYLFNLLCAVESIGDSKPEINYEATWDEFPIGAHNLEQGVTAGLISEQPARMTF